MEQPRSIKAIGATLKDLRFSVLPSRSSTEQITSPPLELEREILPRRLAKVHASHTSRPSRSSMVSCHIHIPSGYSCRIEPLIYETVILHPYHRLGFSTTTHHHEIQMHTSSCSAYKTHEPRLHHFSHKNRASYPDLLKSRKLRVLGYERIYLRVC
jgi:hypothetical protein